MPEEKTRTETLVDELHELRSEIRTLEGWNRGSRNGMVRRTTVALIIRRSYSNDVQVPPVVERAFEDFLGERLRVRRARAEEIQHTLEALDEKVDGND